MTEAWIQLHCPACGEDWEANPASLPDPKADFECESCGAERPMAEFARTTRDLDILEEFQ